MVYVETSSREAQLHATTERRAADDNYGYTDVRPSTCVAHTILAQLFQACSKSQ